MTRLLVPVDGSEQSLRAIDYVIGRAAAGNVDIRLLNVQPPLPSRVASAVEGDVVREYHREEAAKALGPAEARLKKAGVAFASHSALGTAGDVIDDYARETKCDEIVMGVRGLGAVLNLLFGSTTTRVLALTDLPVTLIK
jgi:nucleotide-binding universal stress UspA family protein